MSSFDRGSKLENEVRRCKTRALGARLFAGHPADKLDQQVWDDIAFAWDDLAALKQRIAKTDLETAKIRSAMANRLRDHNILNRSR
jgi:hypothetical protein